MENMHRWVEIENVCALHIRVRPLRLILVPPRITRVLHIAAWEMWLQVVSSLWLLRGGPWSTLPDTVLGSPVFQAESEDVRHVIIPLLLTLMYVLTKVRWGGVGVGWQSDSHEAGDCQGRNRNSQGE